MKQTPADKKSQASEEREERLAVVLEAMLLESPNGASDACLNRAIAENPDLESDLRELWATAMIASDVALFQSAEVSRILDGSGGSSGSDLQKILSTGSAVGALIGDYELQAEIGRGGMGVVYRAFQSSLRRTVALKMIPNAAFAASQDLARLRAEALAAARLSHPNIVPVYEVGEHNGQPWFSMQLIEGVTLS